MIVDEYTTEVWNFLNKLKPGKKYSVAMLAKPATREKFVAAIKQYMDSFPYHGSISFCDNYTRFYRMTMPPIEAYKK